MKENPVRTAGNRKLLWIIAALVLAAGVYARAADLEWHFSHPDDVGVAKTILRSKAAGGFDLFAVSKSWTYAPLQFFFTHFLVHPGQTYRELLFWGRLPSLAFGILALFALAGFYRFADSFRTGRFLTALSLLACSWESIIHAKQMHNYGIGMTGACLMLVLLAWHAGRGRFTTGRMAFTGLALAVISHMHYQILFLMPAFFAALLYKGLTDREEPKRLLAPLFVCGAVYLAAVTPMIYFFLKGRTNAGVYWWSSGPDDEFFYHFTRSMTLLDKILYTVYFFTDNLFLVFQANTAFLPETSPLAMPAGYVLFLLFALGSAALFVSPEKEDRILGVFNAACFGVWFLLVGFQKLTLGPTRHSLILLPLMGMAAAHGVSFLARGFRWKNEDTARNAEARFHAGLSLVILVLFLVHFPVFLKERRDVFIEQEILNTLKSYEVDEAVLPRDTAQVQMMKHVQDYIAERADKSPDMYRTIAWISRIDRLNEKKLEEITALYNRLTLQYYTARAAAKGTKPELKGFPYTYRVIYSKEIISNVEIDYSSRTKNGSNSLYFYILQRDPARQA